MSTNLACVLLTFGHHVVGIDFRFKRSKVKVVGLALGGQLGKGGNMFIMLSVCLNSLTYVAVVFVQCQLLTSVLEEMRNAEQSRNNFVEVYLNGL